MYLSRLGRHAGGHAGGPARTGRHAAPGHNHDSPVDHLHSHLHGDTSAEHAADRQALAAAFIEAFRAATDKTSYLRVAGVPFSRTGRDGRAMHLVDVAIVSNWQVGTASPGFASRELSYLPYPGTMVEARETMTFTYVSLSERADLDLFDVLPAAGTTANSG